MTDDTKCLFAASTAFIVMGFIGMMAVLLYPENLSSDQRAAFLTFFIIFDLGIGLFVGIPTFSYLDSKFPEQ